MKNFTDVKEENIVIDTNILISCGDDRYMDEFKKVLRGLDDNKNSLAISVISGFEIIKKYNKKKIFSSYYLKLLNYIKSVPIDVKISNNAGFIANNLGKDKSKKDNDFIIGATVVTFKNSLLLTCDRKDFKKPYWDVVARKCIYWEDEILNEKKIFNIFLLKPNLDNLLKNNDN